MNGIRSALLGSAAAAALVISTTGGIADGYRAPKYVAPPPVASWTGFYIGAHVGGAWSDVRVRDVDGYNGPPDIVFDTDGAMVGGQFGYNLQMQRLVVGVEVELGNMWLEGDAQYGPYIGVRTPADSHAFLETGFYATVAGRLGVLVGDSVLVYGKAGWGAVDTEVRFIDTDPIGITLVSGTSKRTYLDGAVYGGGIELAMSRNVTLKAEYLRLDVGDVITHTATTSVGGTTRFAHDVRDIDTVKIGVNFKFDHDRIVPLK